MQISDDIALGDLVSQSLGSIDKDLEGQDDFTVTVPN